MTKALLKTGKHTITALTRLDSTNKFPEGVEVRKVDYNSQPSLVEALKGQDALVITLGGMAPPDQQAKLIQAAADANVSWVLPNEWSPDTAHESLLKDVAIFQSKPQARDLITKLGKSSYIAVTTGFWYEWSLAIPAAYGFDFPNRAVTFFDDGETKTSMSTWPQVGRAVASLLSLPLKSEEGDKDRCLDWFKNRQVYISSFTVSQKDMLDSVLRVTKTGLEDWNVTREPAQERYIRGIEAMQKGDRVGFAKMMYTRVFYPDDSGNYEKTRGTVNDLLGLPKEDIDEATEAAIQRSKEVSWS